jgi:hypothetical protein
MCAFLRAVACVWALAAILVPQEAAAQDDRYAVLLTTPRVREVLHCPHCNGSVLVSAGRSYLVRTSEGINLVFDDVAAANRALELVNWMARAGEERERGEYQYAVAEYTKLMAFNRAQDGDLGLTDIFQLLNPKQAMSPLVEYVIPGLHHCVAPRLARGVTSPGHHGRSVVSWSRH